jgi:hypothetical protein
MNAALPPVFWISATTWSASVVLPDASGPKISRRPCPGDAADAEGEIESDGPGGNDGNGLEGFRPELHDGAFSKSFSI